MAISEESRYAMHAKLEEVLGAQAANTMMEYLPPVGWADVATKRDLDAQNVLMRRDLDAQSVSLKHDLDTQTMRLELLFQSEMRGEINRLMLWMFPTLLTSLGLTFAVAKLS